MLLYTIAVSLLIFGGAEVHGADKGTAGTTEMYVDQTPKTESTECVQTIHVRGDEIKDEIRLPCNPVVEVLTGSDGKTLVAGNPEVHHFSVFTDSTDAVMVIQGGKCERRTYKIHETGTTAIAVDLKDSKCEKLKQKIVKMWQNPE